MQIFILILVFCTLISCNSKVKEDKKNKKDLSNEKIDTIKFTLLKDNLYKDNLGNFGFKTIDNSDPQKPVERFITIVWNANPDDSINDGKMDMKNVIDTGSYKLIKGIYYKDKRHFYVFSQMADGGTFAVLQNIDPKTFVVLSPYYAKDINHVYYGSKIIKNADVKTFEPLTKISNGDTSWQYGKDKNYFFFFGEVIYQEELKLHKF